MFNPNNDRLDFGQILAPPADYDLDFAVGTTYSLDLDALVSASLAMGLSEETDSELLKNPVCLLEALRGTGDKVALFCEGGQIHVPNKVTPLYILLEKMVFQVKTSRKKGTAAYPSFHPKFWLLRYKNKGGEALYRVVVLSRNLTFDRSWDVAYYMDGRPVRESSDKNLPLCDFLRFLVSQLPADGNGAEKAKAIRSLIRALPNVAFDPAERGFYDYEFLPLGIRASDGGCYSIMDTRLFQDTFHEIFIMSPFLSGSIVRDFNDRNRHSFIRDPRYVLITRELSLGKLKPEDVSNFTIYTMRESVVDGETAISDDSAGIREQDIHAKVYMMRKYADVDLWLGSMNASHNAVYGNIEFMILLRTKRHYLDLDKLTRDLFGREKDGSNNPFQEVTLQNAIIDAGDGKQNLLDSIIKDINRSGPCAEAEQEQEGYCLSVHFGDTDTMGCRVTVRPLLSRQEAEFGTGISFHGLQMTQLSEFFVFSVSEGEERTERILIIPTSGLPEDREKAVVSSVVSNRDCFYRYVAFLLGDDMVLGALEADTVFGSEAGAQSRHPYKIPALYEKMLKTAATNPQKFRGIEYLIKTIDEDGIIPEEFKKLFDTFRKAVKMDE